MFAGITVTTYSLVFFLPTILKQLGWTSIRAQVMSIPVFIVAAVLTLSAAVLSDHLKRRYEILMASCLLTIVGYAILFSMHSVPVGARYFAVYLMTGGGFAAQTISIVWLSNNMGGHYKRAIGVAMQVSRFCPFFSLSPVVQIILSNSTALDRVRQHRRHHCQLYLRAI